MSFSLLFVSVLFFLLLILFFCFREKGLREKGRVFSVLLLLAIGLIVMLIAMVVEWMVIPVCNLLPVRMTVPASAFIGIAYVEEYLKFRAITFVDRRIFPFEKILDGARCGSVIAIGFALAESLLYILEREVVMNVIRIRMLTAVPLHCATSILMGIAWGKRRVCMRGSASGTVLLATLLHGAYNWILMDENLPDGLIAVVLAITLGMAIFLLFKAVQEDNERMA